MRLYRRVTGKLKEAAHGSYQNQAHSLAEQHGLILPQESTASSPLCPWSWRVALEFCWSRGLTQWGLVFAPHTTLLPNTQGSRCHRDAWFLSARHKNNLLVVQEEEMKLQGPSCPGCSSPHPLLPPAVPQFLSVQAGVQILTTEGCSGS